MSKTYKMTVEDRKELRNLRGIYDSTNIYELCKDGKIAVYNRSYYEPYIEFNGNCRNFNINRYRMISYNNFIYMLDYDMRVCGIFDAKGEVYFIDNNQSEFISIEHSIYDHIISVWYIEENKLLNEYVYNPVYSDSFKINEPIVGCITNVFKDDAKIVIVTTEKIYSINTTKIIGSNTINGVIDRPTANDLGYYGIIDGRYLLAEKNYAGDEYLVIDLCKNPMRIIPGDMKTNNPNNSIPMQMRMIPSILEVDDKVIRIDEDSTFDDDHYIEYSISPIAIKQNGDRYNIETVFKSTRKAEFVSSDIDMKRLFMQL